jgi:hypothetical protein
MAATLVSSMCNSYRVSTVSVHWSVWLLREIAATSERLADDVLLADEGTATVLGVLEGGCAGDGALRA